MIHDPVSCDQIFSEFTFADIRNANPPAQRGVYVLQVKRRGSPIPEMVQQAEAIIQRLQWPMAEKKMLSRIHRLEKIGECPLIYIGSAGTQGDSKNTLHGRYQEFAGRHTIMFPLWALLYFGWDLEYGWKVEQAPNIAEASLKQMYKAQHNGVLPALVQR
ncbi:MAG: hypothetical protein JOZ51_25170 [Chloroflexi bacterium]|nr:hypothetical protein [Chloroflexota bacterium]